uniref:SEA domain-containing protein n=1 Tax=Leptobrachium leishanense TaxID=445787 RepID=A0A8C5MY87_9ANUR
RISKKVKRQLEEPKAHNGGCRDNNCKPENKIVIYQQRNNEKSETLLQPSIAQHEETQRIIKKEGKKDHDDISADRNLGIKNTQRYGVIVEHEVIVEAKYAADVSVSETYDAIVKKVEAQLEDLENNNNCSDPNSLCVANVTVKETPVLTEQEICKNRVGEGLKDFYSPFVTSKGLTCISLCDPNSDKQYTCNTGTCRVQNITGPECLCPEPDKYIYSTDRCEGRLSKAAVYGGVGAAIAVLFIAVLVAVFLLVRARKHAKMAALLKDQDDHWYEDEDDKWSVPLGHDNHNVGDTKDFSSSTKEIFKLKLDKIDTTIQVKIQRPSLYPDWMATYT